jgi:hypothetical protein
MPTESRWRQTSKRRASARYSYFTREAYSDAVCMLCSQEPPRAHSIATYTAQVCEVKWLKESRVS